MTLQARRILDDHGMQNVESILNEWNYVRGWENDDWVYSLKAEKSLKGASFIAATMETCQYLPLDMLMYYDARPCAMNGMFATDYVCDLLKGYYPFRMFNELYKLDHAVKAVKPGATFGFLVPTVDQVSKLLVGLEKGPFADIEVCEILMRNWKPVADRLRPEDRMNAHTGFLIFCRHQERSADFEYSRPLGTRQRKQEAARQARLAESGANPYDDGETAGDDE